MYFREREKQRKKPVDIILMCFVCEWCYVHLIKIQHFHMKLFSSFLNFFHPTPSSATWHNHIRFKHSVTVATATRRLERKIVVVLGATGAGKSRLSVGLGSRFFTNSEIINSDKIQLYSGLDITTNKITMRERAGVTHHLLGVLDPTDPVFTPSDYRHVGSEIISDVKSRNGLPIIVGGSNPLIYSVVTKRYDQKCDVFNGPDPDPVSSEFRYDCCFIWVDVRFPVLNRYLSNRVDEMLRSGMFEELAEFFRTGEHMRVNRAGLGQAIGIPEFEGYFRDFPGLNRIDGGDSEVEAYDEAVRRIKDNTCHLARRQVGKIQRLGDAGWELNRIDATAAFSAAMAADSGGDRVAEIWEKQVVEPSVKIVKQFLDE